MVVTVTCDMPKIPPTIFPGKKLKFIHWILRLVQNSLGSGNNMQKNVYFVAQTRSLRSFIPLYNVVNVNHLHTFGTSKLTYLTNLRLSQYNNVVKRKGSVSIPPLNNFKHSVFFNFDICIRTIKLHSKKIPHVVSILSQYLLVLEVSVFYIHI